MSGSFGRRALRATGLLAIAAVIVFAALPAVAASAAYPTYITSDYSATRSFGISWNGAGIPAGSKFDVEYKDGTGGAWTRWRTATTATGGNFPGLYGHTYWFRYRYITPANVTSYWSRTISFAVPYDNGSLHFSSGWGYVTARGLAFNNTLRYTKRVGASVSYSFTGRRAVVIATKARGRSKMAVYLDGSAKPYRIVDTYYYTTKYRWKVFDYTFKTYGAHKIVIKNLGTRGRPRLDIDGVAVVRPDITGPSGLAISAPPYSNDQTPTVTLSVSDNVGPAQVKVASNAQFTGAVTQSVWTSPIDMEWDLGSAEGTKTVFARFYDEAGNASAVTSRTVVFDKTPPTVVTSGDATTPIGLPRTIEATVTDASPVSVELRYRPVAEASFETTVMGFLDGRYTAEIPGLATMTNVQYYVRATDAAGNVFDAGPHNVGALDVTAPSIPTITGVTVGDRSALVAWSASPETDTAGYRLYRSDLPDGTYLPVADVTGTSVTDTTLLNGHTYYYKVSSYDQVGNESAPSGVQQAVLPQKLSSLAVSVPATAAVGQSFTVTVTATDDNNATYTPPVTVTMSATGAGSLAPTTLGLTGGSGSGSFSYSAPGDIKISATSGSVAGQSATMTIEAVPAPTGLAAVLGDHQVALSWNAVPSGLGVTSYRVYRADASIGPWSQIATASAVPSPSYTDATALNGHTYYYQVSAYGPGTNESAPSGTATAVLPQKLASLAVSVPATAAVGQSFTVSVTAKDDNNATYTPALTVTMSATGAGSLAPTTLGLTGGSGSGSFSYSAPGDIKISATSGSVAGQSATMTIEAVPAPTGLAAVLGDHQVALSWNAVPSGLGVTSYRVYRADASIGPWSQIATASAVPSPSYTDATALNGHTYYYQVSAYGPGTNESAPSGTATAVLPQKLASLAVSVPATAAVGQSFTVSVTAKDDNNATYTPPVTVTMSATGAGSLAPTTLGLTGGSGSGSFSYSAPGDIKISATSGSVAGQSATMTIEAVPAPTGLAAVLGDHQVALSWNAVPSGLGVTSYRVYRADASIGPWSQIATASAVPSPSYTDATALNGHTYYYQVSAYGPGTNESAPSGTATAVLPQKLGSLAVSVPATAAVGQSFTVTVTATDDNGATYTPPVTVTMSATGTGSLAPTTLGLTGGSGSGSFSYSAPGDIKISATSGSVAGQSATMTIEAVPAPTGLAAVLGDHQVALSWNAVPSGLGVTSYRVYRADASIGPWSQIATASAVPSPSYTDATALNGHTYYYQVSAYGPGTNESAPSGTATAVLPQKLGSLAVSVPATAAVGQSFTVSVTATDDNNATYLPTVNASVTADGPGILDPTTLQIVGGSANGSFTYSAEATITITFSATDPVSSGTVIEPSTSIQVLAP